MRGCCSYEMDNNKLKSTNMTSLASIPPTLVLQLLFIRHNVVCQDAKDIVLSSIELEIVEKKFQNCPIITNTNIQDGCILLCQTHYYYLLDKQNHWSWWWHYTISTMAFAYTLKTDCSRQGYISRIIQRIVSDNK